MNGGKYEGKNQKAIVEFLCNERSEERRREVTTAAEDENGDGGEADDEHYGKIKLLSWDNEEDTKVLRLEWNTKYACEDAEESNGSSSGHWGFFTWFILMWVLSILGTLRYLTDIVSLQCFHGSRSIPHFRLVAELQSLFSSWMGPAPALGDTSRYTLSVPGLDEESRQYCSGWRVKRGLQRRINK